MLKEVLVPDIGSYSNVDVIEVLVKPGDVIRAETPLITLETDKATLEVPAPFAGVVKELKVKVGDKVSQGSLIVMVEAEGGAGQTGDKAATAKSSDSEKTAKTAAAATATPAATQPSNATATSTQPQIQKVLVPDIGAYSNVDVIEVLVKPGDIIKAETALITLETDKATLEVPAPFAGVVKEVHVKVGDKVSQGSLVVTAETTGSAPSQTAVSTSTATAATTKTAAASTIIPTAMPAAQQQAGSQASATPPRREPRSEGHSKAPGGIVHAGPGVRRFARELGADITRISGSGPKNRILKQDVKAFVKGVLSSIQAGGSGGMGGGGGIGGLSIAAMPQVDFAKFGEVSKEPLSRIKKLSGSFLHRNWVMVPHITQFDEADITELEAFRKSQQTLAEAQKIKLTPLVFIMKAVVAALKQFPTFNASLDSTATELFLKKYFHIGVAVDTPNGLMVPVVRDVDQKGLFQLAKELGEISLRARNGQLSAQEMQGGCFSISSLGGIGGTAFTPIINVPEVAILGVSKSQIKPVYEEGEFKPRLLLPLSLSYDHRVIDGAEAARFITYLSKQLTDIRRLLL